MSNRTAFFVPIGQCDEHGFIPSVVTENEPGHTPMTGGREGTPWYWGKTYEEAQAVAAKANADKGLSHLDVTEIIASSMNAFTPRPNES